MFQNEFSFLEFGFGSQIIKDLVSEKDTVKPFITDFFSLDKLAEQARKKIVEIPKRELLVSALNRQNIALQLSAASKANIAALAKPKTVTITTGHQLNLLTGPLYTIYKIAQVIGLTQAMNQKDDDFHYVPVFWMATEDHDFDEINHIQIFGNKLAWEKGGQKNRIVGAIEPLGIASFLDMIHQKYQDETLLRKLKELTAIYENSKNLAEATREIINALFGHFGLVIMDGNDPELKQEFARIAQKEVAEGFVFNEVSKTNTQLEQAGYHQQVFVRNCNLFHIDSSAMRERITKEENRFFIGEQELDAATLLQHIQESPVSFSPNALLRPVYQELILPNIAYIGGGGEIAYWLQIKGVFDALNLPFPLLRVRDSLLLLKNNEVDELQELSLGIVDLKRDLNELVKEMALQNNMLDINTEMAHLNAAKETLLKKANSVDKSLGGFVEAEFTKIRDSLGRIEARLIKAEKVKYDQKAGKIKKLQTKIFPNGGFQERTENFLPYFLSDSAFISKIVDTLKAADQPKIKVVIL